MIKSEILPVKTDQHSSKLIALINLKKFQAKSITFILPRVSAFQEKWFLCFVPADSKIAVATYSFLSVN
jgi:hypothetical protein